MATTNKKSITQFLKEHETTVVEVAAVLTAATRWIITFSPIDKTNLTGIIAAMGGWWDGISAFLSVSFAVVEIWATAMIMRAFNIATDKKDKAFLGAVWFVSLVVLAMVQIPPLYASLMDVPVASLEGWNALYVIATSIAAFVVIAGVSYSDRFKAVSALDDTVWEDTADENDLEETVASMTEELKPIETPAVLVPELIPALSDLPSEPVFKQETVYYEAKPVGMNTYDVFANEMDKTPEGGRLRTGYAVAKKFGVTAKTGARWLEKYGKEKQDVR